MPSNIKAVILADQSGQAINTRSAAGFQTAPDFPARVIGLAVNQLRIRAEVETATDAPEQLAAEIRFRSPGGKPLNERAALSAKLIRSAGKAFYEASVSLNSIAPAMLADSRPEVATVVRAFGTSDKKFRDPLVGKGWMLNGAAEQEDAGQPEVTGSLKSERPDAKSLMRCGGVEIIQVTLAPGADVTCSFDPTVWAFIRSPADVFFYSGHGMLTNGNLVKAYGPFSHSYEDWLTPQQLLADWRRAPGGGWPADLDVLVINGCSVLFWKHDPNDPVAADRPDIGLHWVPLLQNEKGPLRAILGYRYKAPADASGGDKIAERMASAIAQIGTGYEGSQTLARKWLEINAAIGAWGYGAAAFDLAGYWYINTPTHAGAGASMIKAVGYDRHKPAGAILGPFPTP